MIPHSRADLRDKGASEDYGAGKLMVGQPPSRLNYTPLHSSPSRRYLCHNPATNDNTPIIGRTKLPPVYKETHDSTKEHYYSCMSLRPTKFKIHLTLPIRGREGDFRLKRKQKGDGNGKELGSLYREASSQGAQAWAAVYIASNGSIYNGPQLRTMNRTGPSRNSFSLPAQHDARCSTSQAGVGPYLHSLTSYS